MLHLKIWGAIDKIAALNGISPSRLAIISGLDPTALNHSKRCSKYGQPRLPNIRTIIKVIHATKTSPVEFAKLISDDNPEI